METNAPNPNFFITYITNIAPVYLISVRSVYVFVARAGEARLAKKTLGPTRELGKWHSRLTSFRFAELLAAR